MWRSSTFIWTLSLFVLNLYFPHFSSFVIFPLSYIYFRNFDLNERDFLHLSEIFFLFLDYYLSTDLFFQIIVSVYYMKFIYNYYHFPLFAFFILKEKRNWEYLNRIKNKNIGLVRLLPAPFRYLF